ncbi:helix-turn-helix domain-containing protein [Alsobacter sp. SYSU M60028]|uniref:Helix-turn-helix domain-containing protein n=1 Tax=Alsobacter ponti TaxID=2962936 RepID=A0ABT1LG97_9HYPH|nr:helix-turn-helix domain-containing protein [Alsobacter ponti]MCP8939923.1 helix-turn-helix domain-containing protein [Alsobacter ponti]
MAGVPGFQRMEAHGPTPSHRIALKRQVVQEYLAGETLHGLAKRHDISGNLIRIWRQKHDAGALDDDAVPARRDRGLRGQDRGSRAALERLVGKQALEIEFLKEDLKYAPRPEARLRPTSSTRWCLNR